MWRRLEQQSKHVHVCVFFVSFWFNNQAINDINSRIRSANEKKKSMSSWPLVVHDFFDIQVAGSNHTCKLMKKMSHDRSISPYIRGLLASGMRSRRRWIPWPPILLASDPSSRMPWMEIWRTYIWAAGLGWSKSSKYTWKFFLVNRDLGALWKNWAPGCQAEEKPSRDYGWIDWIWQENGANHWQKTEVWKIRFFQVVLRYTALIDFSYCYFKIQKSLETCRAKFQLIRI